jgi:uncharacterized protein YejL (UPF0352 family)
MSDAQPKCNRFLDPLIEHDPLILLLDLVLLKPRVFLHLLFNRGTPPLDALAPTAFQVDAGRDDRLRGDIVRLAMLVIGAETMVRLISHGASKDLSLMLVSQTILNVLAETIAQHAVTLLLTLLALRLRSWYPGGDDTAKPADHDDGRRVNFTWVSHGSSGDWQLTLRPMLVPLTLLYTSLLPLVLQLSLAIWYTPPVPTASSVSSASLNSLLPVESRLHPELRAFVDALDEFWTQGDRVWAGTRLLGGMSAGFGLRVLLPTKPWETTAIVLAGWGASAVAAKGLQAALSPL